jgi:hypothetical protein
VAPRLSWNVVHYASLSPTFGIAVHCSPLHAFFVRPLQVVVLFLVRVSPKIGCGRAGLAIIAIMHIDNSTQ